MTTILAPDAVDDRCGGVNTDPRWTMVALGELDRARVAAAADPALAVLWYERKVVVLSAIAADAFSESERVMFAALADQARAHAARLDAVRPVAPHAGGGGQR